MRRALTGVSRSPYRSRSSSCATGVMSSVLWQGAQIQRRRLPVPAEAKARVAVAVRPEHPLTLRQRRARAALAIEHAPFAGIAARDQLRRHAPEQLPAQKRIDRQHVHQHIAIRGAHRHERIARLALIVRPEEQQLHAPAHHRRGNHGLRQQLRRGKLALHVRIQAHEILEPASLEVELSDRRHLQQQLLQSEEALSGVPCFVWLARRVFLPRRQMDDLRLCHANFSLCATASASQRLLYTLSA